MLKSGDSITLGEINKISLVALIKEVNKRGGKVTLSIALDSEEGQVYISGKVRV